MPVTSHFRTDAEALLPNGQWLPVVVDLREDAGELVIESTANDNSGLETECANSSQPSTPNRKPKSPANREKLDSSAKDLATATFNTGTDDVLPTTSTVRRVEIHKGEEGLGISIKGGADHNMPVTVSKIFRGMAADRTRQLFVGDTIISVNNANLQNATHEEAVRALRSAGHTVIIEVQYLPSASVGNKTPGGTTPDKAAGGVESVPLLGDIGWGLLTTLSPARQPEVPDEPSPSGDKGTWWRRVCSLRLAGVHLVTSVTSNTPQSRVSSRNSMIGSQASDDVVNSANRVLRIHSPDLTRSINLRFTSPPIAGCWLSWLGSTIDRLADRFRDRANAFFANPSSTLAMSSSMPFAFPGQFWQVGWLDSLSPLPYNENLTSASWQRVFAVVTDKEFLTFDRAPSLPTLTGHQTDHTDSVFKAAVGSWLSKHEISRIPLIFSRLVSFNQNNYDVSGQGSFDQIIAAIDPSCRHLVFGMRIARIPVRSSTYQPSMNDTSTAPVEWRTFRCDSSSSLAIWCRSVVAGCHRAVALITAIRFAVLFTGRLCALELSEDRIALFDLEVEAGEPAYWAKPLSALASSSDDGNRLLVLDVHGVGTVDLEMASEGDVTGSKEVLSYHRKSASLHVVSTPKPIVFALHSFLSAKLASLGIVA